MKLGFIGCGNMASAMIGGILQKKLIPANNIIVSDVNETNLLTAYNQFGILTTTDNLDVVQKSDYIVLSVKPQFYETVITQIKEVLTKEQVIITIAPGKTLSWLESAFGKEIKLVRTMPNTPALVGEGMTGICTNSLVDEKELTYIFTLFSSFGKVEQVSEHLMDAVGAVSGSSPAYIFLLIEAMADAAVSEGMARNQAYQFAAQAVLGSAKMVLETQKHPAQLKDMVCSPAGTTIEGIRVLEEKGFRSAMIEALKACVKKSKEL